MKEPIQFITNEIWEKKIGNGAYEEEKKSFWRRNNLDLFPVELISNIKGNFMQIRNTLDTLQNSSMCRGVIQDNNSNYRYDDYGRLININFNKIFINSQKLYSTDIEYTAFGKIVTSISNENNSSDQLGTKKFHHYYIDNITKEKKEVQLTFAMNKRSIISRDLPAQVIFINDIIRSIKIGNIYTLFNEYGHVVEEAKPVCSYRTENFYDDNGNRFKSLTHETETGKVTERTFGYDERGNQVFCSLIPPRRYHFEYYRNSLGNRTLHRIRNQNADTVIEFPKY